MTTIADDLKNDCRGIADVELREQIVSMTTCPCSGAKSSYAAKALFACANSDSLKVVQFYISKFIVFCSETGHDPNDSMWYSELWGPGFEMVETSIRGKGTLEIIKYLVGSGFDIRWRPVTTAASYANKFDILKFLVENGSKIRWELDGEGSNTYNSTKNPEIKEYLKKLGRKQGLRKSDFTLYDEA
jgi:hypothetical protein